MDSNYGRSHVGRVLKTTLEGGFCTGLTAQILKSPSESHGSITCFLILLLLDPTNPTQKRATASLANEQSAKYQLRITISWEPLKPVREALKLLVRRIQRPMHVVPYFKKKISPWQNPGCTVWPWSRTATCTACLRCTAAREAVRGTCTDRSAWARPPDRMPGLFWWTQQINRVSQRETNSDRTGNAESVCALGRGHEVYPRKRLRYCRLQVDQEKTPLFPARVGDIMLPSVLRQGFPSPSWIIPKLDFKKRKKRTTEVNRLEMCSSWGEVCVFKRKEHDGYSFFRSSRCHRLATRCN